jgi:deoxyribodipyrimidine photolyase-related protein
MSTTLLLFPHQLFKLEYISIKPSKVYLIEEYLFFKQYRFHQQKILFHRASMKYYAEYLIKNGIQVEYIESSNPLSDIRQLLNTLQTIDHFYFIDVTDDWLSKRILQSAKKNNLKYTQLESPLFITKPEENKAFFTERKKYFQTDYYIWQRKKLNILLDNAGKPLGGKWTFDAENRLKYPKNQKPPKVKFSKINKHYSEAEQYVKEHFSNHYGSINLSQLYPASHLEAEIWLDAFLENRFELFGDYEDAISSQESIMHHSVLTPMLNVGLLTPQYVIQKTLSFAETHNIPINSLEGFIRQIIGWREFIRAVYELEGKKQRTINYWKFTRKIPHSFYTGNTTILPIDHVIKKLNETAYLHHIERLMILGNFMLLCEFHPDQVYQWFMELFIDAYDWVMVPNVYGMTQFADGGLMCTKPYISGSNYIFKMSDYAKSKSEEDWSKIWDGLFWRFMSEQNQFFSKNPRLSMLLNTFYKMPEEKRNTHLQLANGYLNQLI